MEDKDLLCHCELIPGIPCRVRATQEDMLCDSCRARRCGEQPETLTGSRLERMSGLTEQDFRA